MFVPHASEIWIKSYGWNYTKFWFFFRKSVCCCCCCCCVLILILIFFFKGKKMIKPWRYFGRRFCCRNNCLNQYLCKLRTFEKIFTAPWLKNLVEYSYLLPKYSVKTSRGKKWAFSFYFNFCKRGILHVSLWRVAL